jgi:hypothetical protein
MTKTACVFRNEAVESTETGQKIVSVISNVRQEKRFRDDGRCPECFAEMTFNQGINTCDLCGYTECD